MSTIQSRRRLIAYDMAWGGTQRLGNAVVNPMQNGATVGGAKPTGWADSNGGGGESTLTHAIVGVGYEHGMRYVDHRCSGTGHTAGDQESFYWSYDVGRIAAVQNDVFDHAVYAKLIGGSLANITGVHIYVDHFNGAGSYIGGNYSGSDQLTLLAALKNLRASLFKQRLTVTTALTATIGPYLTISGTASSALDYTLRLSWPAARKAN